MILVDSPGPLHTERVGSISKFHCTALNLGPRDNGGVRFFMLQNVYRGLQFILESLNLSFLTVPRQLKSSHKHRAEQLMHVNHKSLKSLCRHRLVYCTSHRAWVLHKSGEKVTTCQFAVSCWMITSKCQRDGPCCHRDVPCASLKHPSFQGS